MIVKVKGTLLRQERLRVGAIAGMRLRVGALAGMGAVGCEKSLFRFISLPEKIMK